MNKSDLILANDLDTLLPAYLVSRLKGSEAIYDSHEYFTEAAGLTGRNFQKKVWLRIEKSLFPRIKTIFTVNQSIADIYMDKYKVPVKVVRNIPPKSTAGKLKTRKDLDLPEDKFIVLLQGAYIDIDRGAKELTEAMQFTENVLLLIIGAGQEIELVKKMRVDLGLEDKMRIYPKMQFEDLQQYTFNVDLGVSIDKPVHLNYKLSLPNKLFDYIQSNVPIMTSMLPELKRVQDKYEIGIMIQNHDPKHIAETIEKVKNSDRIEIWKQNLKLAAEEYTWEKESEVIREAYAPYLN